MKTDVQGRTPELGLAIAGLACGAIMWFVAFEGFRPDVAGIAKVCWDKVGITVVALAPLLAWSVWIAFFSNTPESARNQLSLAYIGTTAQRFGLLGTVIGIVLATVQIGSGMGNGAEAAVTSALPAVGQALISTGVGFGIALVCDFFRYLNRRRQAAEAR